MKKIIWLLVISGLFIFFISADVGAPTPNFGELNTPVSKNVTTDIPMAAAGMVFLNIKWIISLIVIVVFIICFFIACISVEKTKNESIRIRILLENINKIQIALYKKEFNITSDTPQVNKTIDLESVPKSALTTNEEQG